MNDKITREYVKNVLIEVYSKRHAHKDYMELHSKKLKALTIFLNIDNCIVFDYDNKQFNITRVNKDFIQSDIMDEIKYDSLDSVQRTLNSVINKCLSLLTTERSIRDRGQMTTFRDMETVHSILMTGKRDYALDALSDAQNKIYEDTLMSALSLLFSPSLTFTDDGIAEDGLIRWNINATLDDETQEVMSQSLCDYDYF